MLVAGQSAVAVLANNRFPSGMTTKRIMVQPHPCAKRTAHEWGTRLVAGQSAVAVLANNRFPSGMTTKRIMVQPTHAPKKTAHEWGTRL